MAPFAERIGKRAPRTIIQVEHLDSEARTTLWNTMLVVKAVFNAGNEDTYRIDTSEKDVLTYLWTRHSTLQGRSWVLPLRTVRESSSIYRKPNGSMDSMS